MNNMSKKKYSPKQSRSRRSIDPYTLERGDTIRLSTDTVDDDFIVRERTEFYVVLENPVKQKVYRMSLATGKLVDISPAFPIDNRIGW
jgi:hypothetical protein